MVKNNQLSNCYFTNLKPVLSSILLQHLRIAVSKLDIKLASIIGFAEVLRIKIPNWPKMSNTAKDFMSVLICEWLVLEWWLGVHNVHVLCIYSAK